MNANYSFTLPKLRRTLKPIHIMESSDQEIGHFQLYYTTKWDELVDRHLTLFDKSNYRCHLNGQEDTIELKAQNIRKTLCKQKWDIQKNSNRKLGTLHNNSKIKMHPQYSYVTEQHTFSVVHDLPSKTIVMKDEVGDRVATASYDKVVFIGETDVTIHRQDLLMLEEFLLIMFISVKPME